MNKKQRIVNGQGAFNINYSTFGAPLFSTLMSAGFHNTSFVLTMGISYKYLALLVSFRVTSSMCFPKLGQVLVSLVFFLLSRYCLVSILPVTLPLFRCLFVSFSFVVIFILTLYLLNCCSQYCFNSNENVAYKWICALLVFIAIFPTHL